MNSKKVLVTGATGYVGGRLVTELLNAGLQVRVFVRDRAKTEGHIWAEDVEIFEGDANVFEDMVSALRGVKTAYYLLHSLNVGKDFHSSELKMAETFANAAQAAAITQIIYLGGINNDSSPSPHLSSRAAVGSALVDSGIATIEFRAGMVIGSGSASFEMLRHLTHRLPIMTTPEWINNLTHPIAIRDVLWYLTQAALLPQPVTSVFDIGGPNVLSYADLMQVFAKLSKLPRRRIISIPVLTPRLASHWIGLVTPIPTNLAKNLVESLINEVVADPSKSVDSFIPPPPGGTLPVETAIELALQRVVKGEVDTRWSDALGPTAPWDKTTTDPEWAGAATYKDERIVQSEKSSVQIWPQIESIGGDKGWYGSDLLWAARGLIDTAVGGVGLRRGRRHPTQLRVGESLDFWRVEAIERGVYLRLRAEMKLPGEAWLEFEIYEVNGKTTVRQRATYLPKGLAGHMYWFAVAPFHLFVFPTMIRNIVKTA